MSDIAWAILGVVIGAVISGGATIAATLTQTRQRWQSWTRERRYAAYLDFLHEWHRSHDGIWKSRHGFASGEPPEDYLDRLYRLMMTVKVCGSRQAVTLAESAFKGLLAFWTSEKETLDARNHDAVAAIDAYTVQVRKDMHVE